MRAAPPSPNPGARGAVMGVCVLGHRSSSGIKGEGVSGGHTLVQGEGSGVQGHVCPRPVKETRRGHSCVLQDTS